MIDNGEHVNDRAQRIIFRNASQPQIYRLDEETTQRRLGESMAEHVKLFGWNSMQTELSTTSGEVGCFQIFTLRQLQRTLQSKIVQATRSSGHKSVRGCFNQFDRKHKGALDLDDLAAAVYHYNLSVSNGLVVELFQALDSDHDGLLSLAEFVAGLGFDAMELRPAAAIGVSSRRHYRAIKFHHPFHNMINSMVPE